MNFFAQKLRQLRKKQGLTQEELAEMIDVNPVTISSWENGVFLPKTLKIKLLAQALNVPEDALFKETKPNSITVNFYWEVDDNNMNLMNLRPDTFSFGYRNDGQILLAGSFDFNLSVDAIMDKIRAEIIAAKAGKEARDKELKKQFKQ